MIHNIFSPHRRSPTTNYQLPATNPKGFTLIELLVIAAVIMLLAGSGLAAYNNFNDESTLNSAAWELKNNLRLARSWAMVVKKSCSSGPADGYQVSFTSTGYSVQEKCGGSLVGSPQTFPYPSGVTGSSTPSHFIFKPLTGETGTDIIIVLTFKSKTKTVTIKSNGKIERIRTYCYFDFRFFSFALL